MLRSAAILTTTMIVFTLVIDPAAAQSPNPSQLLQGLLSGNQNQDNALRDAFERGYRRGREDQLRADRDRAPPPPDRRGNPDQGYRSQDQGNGNNRNPYGR